MPKLESTVRFTLAAAVASLPLAAAPLAAPTTYYHYKVGEADQAMAHFAQCIVSKHAFRARARHFLRTIPKGPAFAAEAQAITTPDSVPHTFGGFLTIQSPSDLFRAALFTAFYQRDFGRSVPADLAAIPTLRIAAEFDGAPDDIPQAIIETRIVGDCAARADPADVHALLMTKVTSAGESALLDKVVPQLGACLPAGRKLAFSRHMLRGMLAEALYKLREAATPVANGSVRGSQN
jgi:hypothetical protein